MILIGREELNKFIKKHAQGGGPFLAWSKLISLSDYNDFNQLRKTFPSADYVYHKYTIFNIAGNKYRLVSVIDYNIQIVRIKRIWTHAEYSMAKNASALKKGDL